MVIILSIIPFHFLYNVTCHITHVKFQPYHGIIIGLLDQWSMQDVYFGTFEMLIYTSELSIVSVKE